jgi:hypothetical protein
VGILGWVERHWVICLGALLAVTIPALLVLYLVGDLKFAEFLALLVGVISFPVSVAALRLAIHTDHLVTGMANAQFDQKAWSLQDQRQKIEGGTLDSAVAMATDVKALSRIASVADEDVKTRLMEDSVLPAIKTLEGTGLSQFPVIQQAASELVESAKEWGVLEDEVHQSGGQLAAVAEAS